MQLVLLHALTLFGLAGGSPYHLRHRDLAQRRISASGSGDGDRHRSGGSGPHPTLEIVEDRAFNRVGSVRPLELCQGDCSSNDDCAPDLVCFKRNNGYFPDEVPGCDGTAQGTADYCVEAKYSQSFDELTFIGHRGPFGVSRVFIVNMCPIKVKCDTITTFLFSPIISRLIVTMFNIQECAGDCDSNEDCMGDLVCYQQSGGTDADDDVFGCKGEVSCYIGLCMMGMLCCERYLTYCYFWFTVPLQRLKTMSTTVLIGSE